MKITVSVPEMTLGSSDRVRLPLASTWRSTGSAPSSWNGIRPSPMVRWARGLMSSAQTFWPVSASEMASGNPTCPNPPTITVSYFIAAAFRG